MGYLLAKCGKSNGDLAGCRGEGKFWAEEVEVVLVPNICWDKTKHRCAGTVSFLLLLFLKTSMSICKCNDYLCMSTCFEICGSCITPPKSMKIHEFHGQDHLHMRLNHYSNLRNLSLHLKDWLVLGGGQAVMDASSKVLPKAAQGMWSQIMNLYTCT